MPPTHQLVSHLLLAPESTAHHLSPAQLQQLLPLPFPSKTENQVMVLHCLKLSSRFPADKALLSPLSPSPSTRSFSIPATLCERAEAKLVSSYLGPLYQLCCLPILIFPWYLHNCPYLSFTSQLKYPYLRGAFPVTSFKFSSSSPITLVLCPILSSFSYLLSYFLH